MHIVASLKPSSALVALVTLCASWQNTATVVDAQSPTTHFPVFNLNNGVVDPAKTCSATEWSRVQTVVGGALGVGSPVRELLRAPNSNRRLAFKCSDCGGKPLCLATIGRGCALLGKRRLMEQQQDEQQQQRSLTTSPCASLVTAVDSALNAIKTNVSASCQALLSSTHDVQCAEYTYDCDVFGFTVLRSVNDTVGIKLNMTGTPTSICTSLGAITIRADTNFFLGSLNFTYSGTRNDGVAFETRKMVDKIQPYVSFGKHYRVLGKNYSAIPTMNFNRRTLAPGVYTVWALSQDNPSLGNNVTFVVDNC